MTRPSGRSASDKALDASASAHAPGARAAAARIALVTAPDIDVARALARELVESRAAACVNLVPGVESIYRWEGRIETAREILLVAKTSVERVAELERVLAERHPYAVPELVVLAPEHVEAKYLEWWIAQTSPTSLTR